jgi:HD-GYP domain-containing protein (c-di-GMP phosphodiesterase class II)
MLRLELVGRGGRGSAEMLPDESGPLTIGRSPDNDLQIISPFVSRRHGEFTRYGMGMRYRDLNSLSGSYVGGEKIGEYIMKPGDRLHLGSPDGDCLTLLQGMHVDPERASGTDEMATDPDGHQGITEVLQVQDVSRSQYLTQEIAAPTGGRREREQIEGRLRALITLTSDLLQVEDSDSLAVRLLEQVMDILPMDRGMVLLGGPTNLEPRVWTVRSGLVTDSLEVGLTSADEFRSIDGASITDAEPPFTPIGTVVRRVVEDGVGLLTLDAKTDARLEGSESVFLQAVRSIFAAPIASRDQLYGVVYLDTQRSLRKGDEDALDWLVAAVGQAGMVAQKLALVAQQRAMFESMMRGLAASIDARDGLTAGHSARVSHYSKGIAEFMGLRSVELEAVGYAGLLHDYGKIGVDDAVLRKPGRLNAEEYAHVQTHPLKTFNILSKIAFPPELSDIPLMAASHHERMDGAGYPWGLGGDAIPLGGRIIAVADVYDALTRERHYRSPMPVPEVLAHLEEGRGDRFDGAVLDAFFRYHDDVLGPKEQRRADRKAQTAPEAKNEADTDTARRLLSSPTRDFSSEG